MHCNVFTCFATLQILSNSVELGLVSGSSKDVVAYVI
jgi:hypothetical protein